MEHKGFTECQSLQILIESNIRLLFPDQQTEVVTYCTRESDKMIHASVIISPRTRAFGPHDAVVWHEVALRGEEAAISTPIKTFESLLRKTQKLLAGQMDRLPMR